MRVLYLNHVSEMSGAEHSLLELLRGMPRSKVEPVVALPGEGLLADRVRELGIEVVFARIPRLKKSLHPGALTGSLISLCRSTAALGRLVRERAVDVVHSNSTKAHFVGGRVARATGKPAVWHARDVTEIPVGRGLLGRCAARIIAISEAVRLSLLRQGMPADKIRVIYNGVNLSRFDPTRCDSGWRRKHGVSDKEFVFGMVGQMVPWKRHDLFLTAAAEVARLYPLARFWIVGADLFDDHPDLVGNLQNQAVGLGLGDRVTFLGYHTAMEELYAALDALVLPSDCEPFGRVVIEAMAMEKPVIATRAGGPVEIIADGQTGLLVPPGNASELARAMEQLVARPQWAQGLGRVAREHVATRFDIRQTLAATCDLYEEIRG